MMMKQETPVTVESLDQEGRGIAHFEGKVIFIEGALPGERVTYASCRRKPSFEIAQVTEILKPSCMRVEPECIHFGMCGGCSMQHLDPGAQVAAKQRILEDSLERIGKVRPETILPPIHGLPWGYRQRARLSVRRVEKKGKTLIGFHEKRSSFVADLTRCEILPPKISGLISPLAELIDGLSIRERLPQIEVACGDNVDVLVLRIMQPLTAGDEAALRAFADRHAIQFWLQAKGPETAVPFHPPDAPPLTYTLPEFNIEMPFAPTDFTQVNHCLNRVMVHRAIRLLDPQPGERIADFFCGLGNFTLPIARSGAQVLGIEGSAALVKRAAQNAAHNGLDQGSPDETTSHSTKPASGQVAGYRPLAGEGVGERVAEFRAMNLFEMNEMTLSELVRFSKWLIDPPRDGAIELVKAITPEVAPDRIVYVSCNPATLARDAQVLAQVHGYTLKSAGVMNMFPHTSHVESIAVFVRS